MHTISPRDTLTTSVIIIMIAQKLHKYGNLLISSQHYFYELITIFGHDRCSIVNSQSVT